MKSLIKSTVIALALVATPALAAAETTKEFVTKAVTELFVDGDVTAIDRYWSEDYLQHNPNFPSGTEVIKGVFGNMPPNFKYEIGMVIAEDDLVAIHFRVTGFGPEVLVGVDILRVEDGKIVEHWDVLQPEVTETVSGLPMFTPAE